MTATTMLVTGTWITETNTPASGRIEFLPNDVGFVNGGQVIKSATIGAVLDKTGSISVSLIRCPHGYTVTESINGAYRRSYIVADQAGPIDLKDTILPPDGISLASYNATVAAVATNTAATTANALAITNEVSRATTSEGLKLDESSTAQTKVGPLAVTSIRTRDEPWANAKHPGYGVPGGGVFGTNQLQAMESSLSPGATLYLPKDVYRAKFRPSVGHLTWKGDGMYSTIIKPVLDNDPYMIEWAAYAEGITFEDMAFDLSEVNNASVCAAGSGATRNLAWRRCRFFNVPEAMMRANSLHGLLFEDCLWDSPGLAKGQGVSLGDGTRDVRFLGDNRWLYTNGGVSGSGECEDILLDGVHMDMGWWFGVSEHTHSGGSVTYGTNLLTDTAGGFNSVASDLDNNYYARTMEVRSQGSGAHVTYPYQSDTIVDTDAHFISDGVLRGEIIRADGMITRVKSVFSQTKVTHEGWVSDVDRSAASFPDAGTQYQIFHVKLGFITSHTDTAVGIFFWHDMEGATTTPANGTQYEFIRHPIYSFQMDGVYDGPVRKIKIRNSTFRGGWADQISMFSCEADISGCLVEDGEDYGMTLNNSPAKVTDCTVRHQGVVGIWADGPGSEIIANRLIGETWTNTALAYFAGILATGHGSNVEANQLDGLGRPLSRFGICVYGATGQTIDVNIGCNPSRGHAVSDLRVGTDGSSDTVLDLRLWGYGGTISTDGTPKAVIPALNRTRLPVGYTGKINLLEDAAGGELFSVGDDGLTTVQNLRHAGTSVAFFGGPSASQAAEIPVTSGATLAELETDLNTIKTEILRNYSLMAGPVPFDPTVIAGLQFWVSADTLSLSDGGPVASWTDRSGFGRHAVQPTLSLRPLFESSALNGEPVVHFDGVDDDLHVGWSIAQPATIVLVAKFLNNSGFPVIFSGFNGNPYMLTSDGSDHKIYTGGDFVIGGVADTAWHIFAITFNGVSSHFRIDGGAGGTGNCPATFPPNGLTLGNTSPGGAGPSNVAIAEMLLYDHALEGSSLSDLNNLCGGMSTKYALPWTTAV